MMYQIYFRFKFIFQKLRLDEKLVIHSFNFIEAIFPAMACLTYLDLTDTEIALLVLDAKFIQPVSGWLKRGRKYFVMDNLIMVKFDRFPFWPDVVVQRFDICGF